MDKNYKNMDYYELYEYIKKLQAKLDEMTAESKQVGDYADEAIEDASKFLNERNALQVKLDIALEALREIYKRYEHGRGSGAGMVANRALKKLEG